MAVPDDFVGLKPARRLPQLIAQTFRCTFCECWRPPRADCMLRTI